jgi:hypothetical protein
MCSAIDNPASCEIRALIRFLHAKNMSAAEIHRELCAVYGQHIIRDGTVRQQDSAITIAVPQKPIRSVLFVCVGFML